MRIAFLLPNYSGHVVGSVLVGYKFAQQMARLGHSVDVWHPAAEVTNFGDLLRARTWSCRKSLQSNPVPWFRFPPGVRPRFRHCLGGLKLDHDVVVAFTWRALEALDGMKTNARLFGYVVEYETWAEAPPALKARMEHAYLSGPPLLCSSRIVEDMLGQVQVRDVRSCVHGVDREVYRVSRSIADRPMRLGCPIRQEAVKSPEILAAVLSGLRNRFGRNMSIWGFGGDRTALGLRELLDDYHEFPSNEKLAELHNGSSFFLVPSRKEGFGMPAAEAMSCGVAVVSTDNGGIRTFARHGETCWIVPADDARALVEAVSMLVENPRLRTRIAQAAPAATGFLDWNLAGERLSRAITP